MFSVKQHGDFRNTINSLKKMDAKGYESILDSIGELGVQALRERTPKRTGRTADEWRYEITRTKTSTKISWINDSKISPTGPPIVFLIQSGHGTGNGGYVRGIDFINPALKAVFENGADEAWNKVSG